MLKNCLKYLFLKDTQLNSLNSIEPNIPLICHKSFSHKTASRINHNNCAGSCNPAVDVTCSGGAAVPVINNKL